MSKEKNKKSSSGFWEIMLIAIAAFILLSLLSYLDIQNYRWIYELAIIALAIAGLYFVFRKRLYNYKYSIISDNFVVYHCVGSNERVLFTIKISKIKKIINADEIKRYSQQINNKPISKFYINGDKKPIKGILYYDNENKCDQIMTFCPDSDFLELLTKNILDKEADM